MPAPPDRHYEHRFHAGNVGDVWKHVALVAWLQRRRAGPTLAIDTHAGAGTYALGPTGEWTEGIGRLRGCADAGAPDEVRRYLELVGPRAGETEDARPHTYPGSPLLLAALLEPGDRLLASELDPRVAAELREATRDEPRTTVTHEDGLAALPAAVASAGLEGRETFVFVDPPYADRREWEVVPEALLDVHRSAPGVRVLLWYPVKSLARPNAMLGRLEKAGAHVAAIELITSSLASKKNRLNGSGILLLAPDEGLVATLSSLASWLGPRLAVQGGYFNVRVTGFGAHD